MLRRTGRRILLARENRHVSSTTIATRFKLVSYVDVESVTVKLEREGETRSSIEPAGAPLPYSASVFATENRLGEFGGYHTHRQNSVWSPELGRCRERQHSQHSAGQRSSSLSSLSRLKASSSAPSVRRSGPSGVDSLGCSAPLTQSSDAEALGVARRWPNRTGLPFAQPHLQSMFQ